MKRRTILVTVSSGQLGPHSCTPFATSQVVQFDCREPTDSPHATSGASARIRVESPDRGIAMEVVDTVTTARHHELHQPYHRVNRDQRAGYDQRAKKLDSAGASSVYTRLIVDGHGLSEEYFERHTPTICRHEDHPTKAADYYSFRKSSGNLCEKSISDSENRGRGPASFICSRPMRRFSAPHPFKIP
jgi:hypothetical protein